MRTILQPAGLRPARRAERPRAPRAARTENFQFMQSRQRAAMRWRGGLGSSLLRDCSLTFCNLSLCSRCLSFHSASLSFFRTFRGAPLASPSIPRLRSVFGPCHVGPFASASIPCFRASWLRGLGVVVVVVVAFPGGALAFSFVQPSKNSS